MTSPAVAVCAASTRSTRAQLEGDQQQHRQRQHRPGAGDDHLVDLGLQRRGRVAEGARLAGQPRPRSSPRGPRRRGSGPSRRCRTSPESARSPSSLRTPSASPVSIDSSMVRPRLANASPSATSWSPGSTATTSPGTTSSARRLTTCPSRSTFAVGRHQDRELVEGALRLQLLADPDVGVDDRDQPEDARRRRAPGERIEDEEAADDRVEEGEDVAGDDARGRARGGLGRRRRACAGVPPPPVLDSPCSVVGVDHGPICRFRSMASDLKLGLNLGYWGIGPAGDDAARGRAGRRGRRLRVGLGGRVLRLRRRQRARLAGPADDDDQARRRDPPGPRPPPGGGGDGRGDDRQALRAAASSSASAPPARRSPRAGTASPTRSPGAAPASTSKSCARSSPARARSITRASITSCRCPTARASR